MRNEVERGRKARQIAPKSRKSAFLENTTGSKKWPSKISKGTPSEDQRLLAAEGLPDYKRVSAAVRGIFPLPFKRLQRAFGCDLRAFDWNYIWHSPFGAFSRGGKTESTHPSDGRWLENIGLLTISARFHPAGNRTAPCA